MSVITAGAAALLSITALSRPVVAQQHVHAPAAGTAPSAPTPVATADSSARVRLGDLTDQVLEANPRIAASRALARAATERIPGATRPPDPQVQLGLMNYDLRTLGPMAPLGMRQLQVMQMLPLGGKLGLSGRVASAQASAADERASETVWELRSETAMAFYDLYAVERRLAVMRETVRLLQDIEKTTAAMYRVGEGRQADVLRAQVALARMAEDTLRMIAMRQTMTAKINALRDRPLEAPLGSPAIPVFPDSVPAQAWLDSLARDARPMIRAGVAEVRGAEAAEALARKEIWPDLQVGAQYGQRGGDMGGTEHMGSLMVGASIPIFAKDRQYRMRDETNAMTRMAQADLAAMRAETRGRVGEAYANLRRARQLAQLYRTTVIPQAEATVASAMAAYRVGTVDFMTLLDSQMSVNNYRQELLTLDADQGKAWAELEMLVGRALLESNRISAAARGNQ